MSRDLTEESPRPKPSTHTIGQDLYAMSVAELVERIALLRAEIERLETARAAKDASRSAAASAFKP